MVVWQGITSDGVSVPVQVTEEGKVVSQGQPGSEGPPGPAGPPGEKGDPGEYGPGDDVEFGSITAAGSITAEGSISVGEINTASTDGYGAKLDLLGAAATVIAQCKEVSSQYTALIEARRGVNSVFSVLANGTATNTGPIAAAGNKAGFTDAGEVYFTSRNERYRLVVSNSLVTAEPYTREMELREKAQQDREPRTQDIVPED